jgi:tetratricopeptide (TPR) repeat protein
MGALMYKQGTGLIARTRLEGFRNSLGRYMGGRAKAEVLEQALNAKRAHVALLQQQPTTASGVYELKGAVEQRIVKINDEIPRLESRLTRLEQGSVGKAAITHWSKKLENIKAEKLALQAKYKQLSYWEIVKNKPERLLTAAKDGVRNFTQSLKGKSKVEIAAELGKFVTAPLWMPYRYGARIIKRYYEFYTKPDAAKATAALEKALAQKGAPKLGSSADALTNLKAFSDVSVEINGLVKGGRIKEAVKLYQSARIYANSLNPPIPFAALDRSFMGHLHRVAPATANYFSKTMDLTDPDIINGLPEKISINTDEWKKMTGEHATMLARMSENVKIGGSFVKHENAKEPEKSKLGKAYDATKSAAIKAGRIIGSGAESAYEKSKKTADKILSSISLPGWMSVKTAKETAGYIAEKAKQVGGTVRDTISPQAEIALTGATTASLEALSKANEAVDKSIEEGNLRKAIEKYHDARLLGARLTGKAQMALDWDRSFLEYIHKVVPESTKHIKDISDLRRLDKVSQLPEKLNVNKSAIADAKAKLDADVKKLSNTYLKQ